MFTQIDIENLRIVRNASFHPQGGLNIITGENGAGKTTLLEAAYLVAVGRSFRNRETTPLISEGEDQVRIVSRFLDSSGTRHLLGMEKDRHNMVVRMDGRRSVKRSEIMHLLPLHFIGSDPQELITGAPELRRSFLDGGLFHVEPGYLKTLQEYARVVGQRNAALRKSSSDVWSWDPQFVALGKSLDVYRRRYVDLLRENTLRVLSSWGMDLDIGIEYRSGWNRNLTLEEAISRARESDTARVHTTVGPHRADLIVNVRNLKGGKVLSRGQQKMLIVAFHLAQSILSSTKGERIGVLLFDDFAAELDKSNRERLLETITRHYPQVITTVLDPEDFNTNIPSRMFHVKHGTLEAV